MILDKLFPYQETGVAWLAEMRHALLADDMGLGKSAQVVVACDRIGARRVLVLCPAVARVNWIREFEKFSNQKREVTLVQSSKTEVGTAGLVVCSYDLAHALCEKGVGPFDVLVLDECHYLKSPKTKRTKSVFGTKGLVRQAARVWALSGTPAPNHPGELWPVLYTFGATPLNYEKFLQRYCTLWDGPHGVVVTGSRLERIPELKNVLSKVMLRRKKEDVLKELPPIFYSDIEVEASPVDLENLSSFGHFYYPIDRREELTAKLEKERQLVEMVVEGVGERASKTLKALEAMANSVATLRRYCGVQKVDAVAELVSEELKLGIYKKIVIFALHRDVIDGLRRKLDQFSPVTYYGATEDGRRQRNIDRFQKDKTCKVFIGNIQAAGTSITLTAANNVIFVEQDWVPGNNAQAAMRCHRIGQTNTVFVRFVGLANSVDSKVSQALKRKTRELTKIFDDDALSKTPHDDNPFTP